MKHLLEHVNAKLTEFSTRPLFVFLRDEKVDPMQRLRFVPYVTHFVMSFADLYHFVLREPVSGDRYAQLVNTHLSEDSAHWKWFLSDLSKLGMDPSIRFTDAVRFLWGESTIKTRALSYEMCKISEGLGSLQKLAMVLAIEATGSAALGAAACAGRDARSSGRNLVYFGPHHFDTESDHTLEDDEVRRTLENVVLTEAERTDLEAIVDRVFLSFEAFTDEVLVAIREGKDFAPETLASHVEAPTQ